MTVTRFAPSPTGWLHLGHLRPAMFNFLIARKAGGQFILRIDDTDPERSKEEYVDGIKRDLEWLGIEWDREERQSARIDRYDAAASHLREINKFYEAFETPVELDLKRKKQMNMGKPPVYDRAALSLSDHDKAALRTERGDGVWRFLLDQERIEWTDGILGDLSIDAASVSDPVLIRADGQYLYTLASVVDDIEMGVTHVVRGSDHVTNTATQIQMIRTLGGTPPTFAHHSLLTGPQGEKLSKRDGQMSLTLFDLREAGVEPEAILSLMARIGSSQPVELRLSIDELVDGFTLDQFGSAPTKLDAEDLWPLSAKKLHGLSFEQVSGELEALGVPKDKAEAFWNVTRENITKRSDLVGWWALFRDGAEPLVSDEDADFIAEAMALLPEGVLDGDSWGTWTKAVKAATGRKGKGLFMPLRKAITGLERGPEMSEVLSLMQQIPARALAK